MCHYCGCREIPLIKGFIAEHEAVTDAAGDALRALDSGDLPKARALVSDMTAVLLAHWKGEEDGLFRASLTALTGDDWTCPSRPGARRIPVAT
ncbi:hypothetical protein [Streptomyces sp. ISL-43]|uniref:hypothetical protein n=1 Tax=Streptomyces sp. ISL-43 TaxID=2819183 RepID=UPI0020353735|nr:hypothetical protein [Streptomyces sp. ISL-43]